MTVAAVPDALPLTLGRAWDLLETFFALLAEHCPDLDGVEPAGDVRRFEPIVDGAVVVARAADPPAAIDRIASIAALAETGRTLRRIGVRFRGTDIDVRVAAPDEYGTLLFAATGTAEHVERVRRRRGSRVVATEAEVYAHAGLQIVPPELRTGGDELAAAEAGTLPRLVARADVRGDLHMHTTASDGTDSLSDVLSACAALGYEYVAITDHSRSAAASRTVDVDGLARQRDQIAELRPRFPAMTVLHGSEVEILPDGRLDFEDAVLATLDIVLASMHERARQSGQRLTDRYIRVMRHPLVSIITHPANQLVGRREGYDLEYARLYEAAAETGTVLEIDGAPGHLDLDGAHARDAVRAGVTVSIDSDCHRARSLERQMRLGIGTARRGWVEPRHVLNTRPVDDLRQFLSAKRGRPPA